MVYRAKCILRKDSSLHFEELTMSKTPLQTSIVRNCIEFDVRPPSSIQSWCKFMHRPSVYCWSSAHPIYASLHPPPCQQNFARPQKFPIVRNSLSNALNAAAKSLLLLKESWWGNRL